MAIYQPENLFAPGSNAQLDAETLTYTNPKPNYIDLEGTNVNKLTKEQMRTVEEQIRMAWEPMDMDELPSISGFELNVDYNIDLQEYSRLTQVLPTIRSGLRNPMTGRYSSRGRKLRQWKERIRMLSSHRFSVVGVLQKQKISAGAPADAAQAAGHGEEFQQWGNFSAALAVGMQAANRPDVKHRESVFMGFNVITGTTAYDSGSGLIGHELASSASNACFCAANTFEFDTAPPNHAFKFTESTTYTTTIPSSTKNGKGNTNENERIVLHENLLKDVDLTFTNNLVSSLMLNQHQDPVAAREKIDNKSADTIDVGGKEMFLAGERKKWAMGQTEMVPRALAKAAGIDWEEDGMEQEMLDGA
ncbi:hypothetical protein RUND412_001705 [Rhizina undulata]